MDVPIINFKSDFLFLMISIKEKPPTRKLYASPEKKLDVEKMSTEKENEKNIEKSPKQKKKTKIPVKNDDNRIWDENGVLLKVENEKTEVVEKKKKPKVVSQEEAELNYRRFNMKADDLYEHKSKNAKKEYEEASFYQTPVKEERKTISRAKFDEILERDKQSTANKEKYQVENQTKPTQTKYINKRSENILKNSSKAGKSLFDVSSKSPDFQEEEEKKDERKVCRTPERIYQETLRIIEERDTKIEIMKNEDEEALMRECTFSPSKMTNPEANKVMAENAKKRREAQKNEEKSNNNDNEVVNDVSPAKHAKISKPVKGVINLMSLFKDDAKKE